MAISSDELYKGGISSCEVPIIRVARTIADLAGERTVGVPHIAEAIHNRRTLLGLLSGVR